MLARLSTLAVCPRPIDDQAPDPRRLVAFPLRYLPILILALAYLFLVLINGGPLFYRLDPAAHLFDEGIQVTGAARLLNGDVLYRDWWAYYAPGQYYTLAGLFKLFGASLEVERLWDFVARALLSIAVYIFAAKLTSVRFGLIPFVVVVLWLASCGFYGYLMFPALAFAMISMICLLTFFHDERRVWLMASGVTLGIATIYRHDVGVYAGSCQALTLTIFWIVNPGQRSNGLANQLARLSRVIGPYAIGFLLPVLPVSIYFLRSVPLQELFYDFIVFPLTVFPGSWSLRYPPILPDLTLLVTGEITISELLVFLILGWIPFYVPLLLYALGFTIASTLILRPRVAQNTRLDSWGIFLLTLFGITLFNQVINRSDWIHHIPTSIMSIVLLATLYYHAQRLQRDRIMVRISPLLVLVALSWATHALIIPVHIITTIISPSSDARMSEKSDAGLPPRGQAQAIQFIQQRVPPSETIFVGNIRHDISSRNDAMFYFLSQRQNATRYDDLLAARVNRALVQEEITQSLESNNVRYIVLFTGFFNRAEPNQSSLSSGVTLLDEFIRARYIRETEYGDYTVWVKR